MVNVSPIISWINGPTILFEYITQFPVSWFKGWGLPDYFKTLWSRFKRQSNLLEQGQTLYSFRHSGAIEIFKRTGSITKLQKAMGHSSINVSLTYLRGLEIAELKEEDMPMV